MRLIVVMLASTASTASAFTVSPARKAWIQEAEKKHGRVAMLGFPALVALAATHNDPVPWLNSQPVATQLVFYSTAAALESFNLRRLDKGFTLKEGEVPGKLLDVGDYPTLEAVETLTGRAAMIASAAVLFMA